MWRSEKKSKSRFSTRSEIPVHGSNPKSFQDADVLTDRRVGVSGVGELGGLVSVYLFLIGPVRHHSSPAPSQSEGLHSFISYYCLTGR